MLGRPKLRAPAHDRRIAETEKTQTSLGENGAARLIRHVRGEHRECHRENVSAEDRDLVFSGDARRRDEVAAPDAQDLRAEQPRGRRPRREAERGDDECQAPAE